jgi:hypothetical protein
MIIIIISMTIIFIIIIIIIIIYHIYAGYLQLQPIPAAARSKA